MVVNPVLLCCLYAQVQRYVDQCVANISRQESTVKSMKIVMELLKTLPIVSTRGAHGSSISIACFPSLPGDTSSCRFLACCADAFASQQSAVSYLIHTYDITALVLKDLSDYKLAALEAAGKLGMQVPSQDATGGDAIVLVRPDTHLNCVKARLDFLGFLLSTNAVELSVEMVGSLWSQLVLNNITAAEREAFFSWLSEALERPAITSRHGESIVDSLFDTFMMDSDKLRSSCLGPAGFAAFSAAFKFTNVREGKLRQGISVLVLESDLHGIDALWNVALEVCTQ